MNLVLERISRNSLVVLVAIPLISAQADPNLKEADARGSALDMISAAEGRFDCEFQEHSVKELGVDEDTRYLFRLEKNGSECDRAMLYLANLAARDDKLIFRSLENVGLPNDGANPKIVPPMPFGQDLIHEVNPEVDEN